MTEHDTPFGTAMHDRVRDEYPDLDELIRVSTDRGTRIRRWRRAGASAAAVGGCVAVVAIVGTALGGSDATTGGTEAPIASQPTVTPHSGPAPQIRAAGAPVHVDATGWQCDRPADEKFLCHKEGDWVVVNWRDSDERRYYLDPDKADVAGSVHTYVSEAHGKWFATVAPAQGTSQAAVDEVGMNLVWVA